MNKNNPPILITGASGFIAGNLFSNLDESGYEVWGTYNSNDIKRNNYIKVDLTEREEVNALKEKLPKKFILIHSAALAHENSNNQNDVFEKNVKMTRNLINVFSNRIIKFIFLSSVSVYGEAGNKSKINIKSELRPYNDYGRSKVRCEELILDSNISNYLILRLAPVFDEKHLQDVKKRAFFPYIKNLKILITPVPYHSFLHIKYFCKIFNKFLNENENKKIKNISDTRLYSQKEISDWFTGISIRLPEIIFSPIYWLTYLLPWRKGHYLRCFYWKFFKSNLYE